MDLVHIGYCGADRAACPDYMTGKCPDCRENEWPDDDPCLPVACCRKKGIDCCGQCDTFPCESMAGFYEESEGHRAAYERMKSLKGEDDLR